MHRAAKLICVSAFLLACVAFAQAPPPMPKPGPEHKRFHYYVGEWKNEGEMKASPFGPAGKFTGTDRNQMLGDFFLAMHSESQTPMGAMKSVAVLGYDPEAKAYTFDGFDTMGMHSKSKGTVSSGNWTWTSEENMGGKKFHGRFTIKEVSPTSYTYKYEMSEDGKTWNNIMEGKATKVK